MEMKRSNLIYHGCDFFVWLHGQEFYRAATVLKKAQQISAPYYICLSFSIELFIKCLYTTTEFIRNGSPTYLGSNPKVKLSVHPRSRQHSLSDLFGQLPKKIKSDCEKKYSKKYSRLLNEDMDHISDVFVKYRYLYEDINTNTKRELCVSIFEDIGEFFNDYSTIAGNFSQALE